MDLVIFIGLQGAGKSSFYRARFTGTHDWISKDRLRNNRRPARRQQQLLEEALGAGRSVVVDNTNATQADRKALIDLGRACGARILGYYFESRLADCLERNRQRTGKERVPDVALYISGNRLTRPCLAEGFDQLFFVRLLGDGRFEVRDWDEAPADDAIR
jgi:predicted kinase